jgi:hypothetical protein
MDNRIAACKQQVLGSNPSSGSRSDLIIACNLAGFGSWSGSCPDGHVTVSHGISPTAHGREAGHKGAMTKGEQLLADMRRARRSGDPASTTPTERSSAGSPPATWPMSSPRHSLRTWRTTTSSAVPRLTGSSGLLAR